MDKNRTLNIHIRKLVKENFMNLDPGRIEYFQEYEMLQNLLSPLVSYNGNNELVAGLAKSFEWQGASVVFRMRDLKTVDGFPVTADDAAFSLKRIMVKAANTHGRIAEMLCGRGSLNSIEDECDGIATDGQNLILTPRFGRDLLLPMLTAVDFGVIRRDQVDPKTLKIIDFRNTSGPYYLDAPGVLKANSGHWLISQKTPSEVRMFTETDFPEEKFENAPQMFIKRKVDFVSPGNYLVLTDLVDFAENCTDCRLRQTRELFTQTVVFTERGQKELSSSERIAIGKAVRQGFLTAHPPQERYHEKAIEQFFLEFGEGGLSDDQLVELRRRFSDAGEPPQTQIIFAGFYPEDTKKLVNALASSLPSAEFLPVAKKYAGRPWRAEPDYPHLYIAPTDSSWDESISLLSYSFSMGCMPLRYGNGQEWLTRYMSIDDKRERLPILRDMHLEILTDPTMVPLTISPYYSIVRKPWREEPSVMSPANGLWQITID